MFSKLLITIYFLVLSAFYSLFLLISFSNKLIVYLSTQKVNFWGIGAIYHFLLVSSES